MNWRTAQEPMTARWSATADGTARPRSTGSPSGGAYVTGDPALAPLIGWSHHARPPSTLPLVRTDDRALLLSFLDALISKTGLKRLTADPRAGALGDLGPVPDGRER